MFFEGKEDCQQLYAGLTSSCTPEQASWLEAALKDIATATHEEMHFVHSAMARRKIGDAPVKLPYETRQRIGSGWFCSDAARVLMLEQLIHCLQTAESSPGLIQHAYQSGDEHERAAILKGLTLLDPEGKLVETAIHCARTNSYRLLSALALLNPYPAQHFTEKAFNQLVLKALFMDMDIRRIVLLKSRRNPALNQMCLDYTRGRIAADRSLPNSIGFAIATDLLCKADHAFFQAFIKPTLPEETYNELAHY